MQDSALTPGNVLTLMNSSAKRPEMNPEVQGISRLYPEGFWITCSVSFLLFPVWQIHSSSERSRSHAMLCFSNWPLNLCVQAPPSSLDMARSVRLIFNWNIMSITGELPALLLLALQVAEECQPGQATWKQECLCFQIVLVAVECGLLKTYI